MNPSESNACCHHDCGAHVDPVYEGDYIGPGGVGKPGPAASPVVCPAHKCEPVYEGDYIGPGGVGKPECTKGPQRTVCFACRGGDYNGPRGVGQPMTPAHTMMCRLSPSGQPVVYCGFSEQEPAPETDEGNSSQVTGPNEGAPVCTKGRPHPSVCDPPVHEIGPGGAGMPVAPGRPQVPHSPPGPVIGTPQVDASPPVMGRPMMRGKPPVRVDTTELKPEEVQNFAPPEGPEPAMHPRIVCSLPPTGKPRNWCGTVVPRQEPMTEQGDGPAVCRPPPACTMDTPAEPTPAMYSKFVTVCSFPAAGKPVAVARPAHAVDEGIVPEVSDKCEAALSGVGEMPITSPGLPQPNRSPPNTMVRTESSTAPLPDAEPNYFY